MFCRALFVAGFLTLSASAAHAQFRPGSTPDGGRVGSLCNDERLSRDDKQQCEKLMRKAKTAEERATVREMIQERVGERQKEIDEQIRKDPTLNALRNCGIGRTCN
jgi:hypothetical protein